MLELKFTNREHTTVPLDKPRITLGSDPCNDVVLSERGIAGFQMEFFRQDDQVLAVDLVGNSCTKNGAPIEGSAPIQIGDLLNLESIEIEVVDPLLATEKFDAADLRESDRNDDGFDPNVNVALVAANDGSSTWSLKGLNEAVAGLRFPLGGKVVVGRDPSCDLVLKTAQVSRRHTEIEVLNSQLFIRDLGSTNGTSVNGKKITTAMVRPGDVICMDLIEFLVEGPENDEDATVARHLAVGAEISNDPYLLIRTGSRAGQQVALTKARYTLGRKPDNDIILEDQSVSGRHAVLVRTDGGWKIEDAESTNGTSINGELVMGGQLHHGDRVRLGSLKLAFMVPAELAKKANEAAGEGGFDPNATVRTYAIGRPGIDRKYLWGGAGVVALLLAIIYLLVPSRGNLPLLEPITEPLSASVLWQRQLPAGRSYPAAPLLADVNGDDYLDVVLADGAGHLLVLDGEEGKQIFDLAFAGRVVGSPIAADLTGDGIEDIVVASFEGVIQAVNGRAQLLWKTGANKGYGAIYARPELVDLDGNSIPEVLIATSDKGLVALNATNGEELWNSASIGLVGVRQIPLVADLTGDGASEIVVSTDNGQVWALTADLQGVARHWQRELPQGALSAPMLAIGSDGPLVVVAAENAGVYALFGNSGLISWQFSGQTPYWSAPMVMATAAGPQQVVVISKQGVVTALSASTGETGWQLETGAGIVANAALFDLTNDSLADLILVNNVGHLIAIDAADGNPLLTSAIDNATSVMVAPVIGDINNDQVAEVVVADQQGAITALTINRTLRTGSAPWANNLYQRSATPVTSQ